MVSEAVTHQFRRFVTAALMLTMLNACTNSSAETAAAKHAAQQHAAMANFNHQRRLAWQKAHPRQWAAEQEAAHAEAARRVAERQQQQRQHAAKEAADASYAAEHTPCKEFGRSLEDIHAASIISGYDCSEIGGKSYLIHVTVRDDAWSTADYDERLRLAKGLWSMCVKAAHPEMADFCHVKLVGQAGEELGGSSSFAGSMIDVNKE